MNLVFSGYFPGVIGKVVELHAVYYHQHWGFDVSFETQVGRELSDFMAEFRQGRDFLSAALVDGAFAGAIAIDGKSASTEGARLRWFIVSPRFQGLGVGKALISQAVDFCRVAGFSRIFLWTFRGLDAARRLYEQKGFVLTEEHEVSQWATIIWEQRFDLIPE
ncbi:MAG: GNAT family N-acetyltransferase [Deltaproteobacteria bacterium]|nr:GNAT family N-acetyltransferase [Deltaproteobacteria bacterium]